MTARQRQSYHTGLGRLRRRGLVILSIAAFLVLLVPAGCSRQQPAETSDVVAKIDDIEITQADFDARLALYGILFGSGVEEQLKDEATQQQILDELVEETLLLREAKDKAIEADPEEVQAEMDNLDQYLQSQFGDEEAIKEQLADRGLAETAIHDFFKERLLIQALYEQVTADVAVTDDEVQQYYDDNQQQFAVPEQIHAAHILVETEEEAQSIIDELNNGADFAELAKQYSIDDTNADQGGDLGFFHRGVMLPEFEDAAFALQPGEITQEPVKTTYGFHVIKLIERTEARVPDFEEIQDQVRDQLLNEKRSQVFTSFVDDLKSNAEIETSF